MMGVNSVYGIENIRVRDRDKTKKELMKDVG